MSKRKHSTTYPLNDTITINDPQTAHDFLAPNEYPSSIIGIPYHLFRSSENERFNTLTNFENQLDLKEKSLSNKCQFDIERCAVINRLRCYLRHNNQAFEDILRDIQGYLKEFLQDLPLARPKDYNALLQQCTQRNEIASRLQKAYRMRRLQYYSNNDTEQSMNMITLQNWISNHFHFLFNLTQKVPDRTQFFPNFETLLNNSFFIIQHPSPPIVTHPPGTKDGVTAKISCRLLCLLNRSNPAITIDNIIPIVYRLTTSYQIDEPNVVYQQSALNWKTCSIILANNTQKIFSFVDLSAIILQQAFTMPTNGKQSTGKAHYAPVVYRIDFRIQVTIRFPDGQSPYQHCVAIQSAPFGLISNTSQTEDLFARVFIEDLKSWSIPPPTVPNDASAIPISTNLTIETIVNSIARYFVHQTGIQPKPWVMLYIDNVLKTACSNQSGSIENLCHAHLVKILAQIDYMAEHPLLSLFHEDGLFLGICDSDMVSQNLLHHRAYCQKSVCAIRFGSMSRMNDLKHIGIRVDLREKSSNNLQQYKFDETKVSSALGLYIIKISLCQVSHFDSILTSLSTGSHPDHLVNITKFVELYHSKKLSDICPHEDGYSSIWDHFHSYEHNDASSSSIVPSISPTYTTTTTNVDNNNSLDTNPYSMDQIPSVFDSQTSPTVPSNFISPPMNQMNNNPPIVIVITNPNPTPLSDADITSLINTNLPQFSQSIQPSSFYRINLDQTSASNPNSVDDLFDFLQ